MTIMSDMLVRNKLFSFALVFVALRLFLQALCPG